MFDGHGDCPVADVLVIADVIDLIWRKVPFCCCGSALEIASIVVRVNSAGEFAGGARTEVGNLIHVNPKAVEWDLVVEISNFAGPPCLGVRVHKIW